MATQEKFLGKNNCKFNILEHIRTSNGELREFAIARKTRERERAGLTKVEECCVFDYFSGIHLVNVRCGIEKLADDAWFANSDPLGEELERENARAASPHGQDEVQVSIRFVEQVH